RAAVSGRMSGYVHTVHLGLSVPVGIVSSALVALTSFVALQPIARRWGAIQIPSCWVTLRRFARGRATWLDEVIENGAERLVAAAQGNDVDEIVVVGHSAGCVIASAVLARALEFEPELGRS